MLLSLVCAGIIVFGFLEYDEKIENSFLNKDKTERVTDSKQLQNFESGATKKLVVAIYKTNCPVCEDKQYSINRMLGKQNAHVMYINATKGLPDVFKSKISPSVFKGAKTPYILVLNNKSYTPTYAGRLDTDKKIVSLGKMLKNQ